MIHDTIEINFAKREDLPNNDDLIGVQEDSYRKFLQADIDPENRKNQGLQAAFNSYFPIKSPNVDKPNATLEFVSYELVDPIYSPEQCRAKHATYESFVKLNLKLVTFDNSDNDERTIRGIKQQSFFVHAIPLMTENGTFVINGNEKVIIAQIQRSQGVSIINKPSSSSDKQMLYSARIIPQIGHWIDIIFDTKDHLYISISKKRKIPLSTFLRCLPTIEDEKKWIDGDVNINTFSNEDLLNTFYDKISLTRDKKLFSFDIDNIKGLKKSPFEIVNVKSEVVINKNETISLSKLQQKFKNNMAYIEESSIIGKFVANNTGEGVGIIRAGYDITLDNLSITKGLEKIEILAIDHYSVRNHMCLTIQYDGDKDRAGCLAEVYSTLRAGERPTLNAADRRLKASFFDTNGYDLSAIGRFKMNERFNENKDPENIENRPLCVQDILNTIKSLMIARDLSLGPDEIDHLANRRVITVGELVGNQYKSALRRLRSNINERMNNSDIINMTPMSLINGRTISSALNEFFGMSSLSKFMEQVNPLSEVAESRRLSAMGPGGMSREHVSIDARDVHYTHYGRICPITTPEGPNIGLILALASHSRINHYGFLESPYYKVVDGKRTDEVVYLTAIAEDGRLVAPATTVLDKNGKIENEWCYVRHKEEIELVKREQVEYIDVSSGQIASVEANLVPFLENNDASRALMASNMQRQALPLIKPKAPLVGTGMEKKIAVDSRSVVIARTDGIVESVDAKAIVIRSKIKGEVLADFYKLNNFNRSNGDTIIHQRPLVSVGESVKKGDVLADGACTENGKLALGQNVLVAFMPWRGYNFEDGILLSERLIKEDVYTSVHVKEEVVVLHDTKLGEEIITREVPHMGEYALRHLDEAGIVNVGTTIKKGDIVVGKITPKGEATVSVEEKLLNTIFGEKTFNYKDTSFRCSDSEGTVIGVSVLTRQGLEKDQRTLMIETQDTKELTDALKAEEKIYNEAFIESAKGILIGNTIASASNKSAKKLEGDKITQNIIDELSLPAVKSISLKDDKSQEKWKALLNKNKQKLEKLVAKYELAFLQATEYADLPPGVLKEVRIYIAYKSKIQPGDKMAGRHGNKGIVSKILPVEDMPHMKDGTSVDIVLNPLGIPSRMNVGQLLETHIGRAAQALGQKLAELADKVVAKKENVKKLRDLVKGIMKFSFSHSDIDNFSDKEVIALAHNVRDGLYIKTPIFNGASFEDVKELLEFAGLEGSGQVDLYDGITGKKFDRPVTVGYKYMLKLNHLVDKKIHARSVGPYSIITQQPLRGRVREGGQRFGEMEVWALASHGAAYTLREMLTVKSDDVTGRLKAYDSIVNQRHDIETHRPEIINVIARELEALALNIEFKKSE
ncbi:MAG: DNA-directed RNA polymerase subunit beta [Alphaproteobacteria bacterium]|nr:DNA-directed RNA polymerase subunit beta [Alphaproteobacteria bacterium]